MKRILSILLMGAMLVLLASCNQEFIYRENHFGDSMEQVQQNEGSDGELTSWSNFEDYQILLYQLEGYHTYNVSLYYSFKDNELKHIYEFFTYNVEKQQDVYDDLKKDLMRYGTPTEESKQPQMRKALWITGNYGIVLLVMDNAVLITYSLDSSKAKTFYSTYQISDLLSEGKSVVPTPQRTPKGWGSLNVDSFIPIPQQGCDYIVRNSIRKEELSIFKDNPSIQQIVSAFGYPAFAIITNSSSDEKEIDLFYTVDGHTLDIHYDEGFNLRSVYYGNEPLREFPETNTNLDAIEPVGIIRNDITRDELSFITVDTTPEDLQDVLGAPHRECYTFELLFDRLTNDCITFFMANHFLYPLTDGTILDIKYSREKNKDELYVSSAVIYDEDGQYTVLVDRY